MIKQFLITWGVGEVLILCISVFLGVVSPLYENAISVVMILFLPTIGIDLSLRNYGEIFPSYFPTWREIGKTLLVLALWYNIAVACFLVAWFVLMPNFTPSRYLLTPGDGLWFSLLTPLLAAGVATVIIGIPYLFTWVMIRLIRFSES